MGNKWKASAANLFVATALGVAATMACAEDIDTARIAVPSWPGFTNEDGTGLYFEVFEGAFAEAGIGIDYTFYPMNRSIALVESGDFDMTGGLPRDDRNFAPVPLLLYSIGALYHSDVIEAWDGPASLEGLNLVGAPQSSDVFGMEINEVDDRLQAVELLLRRRADAYMDTGFSLSSIRDEGLVITEGTDRVPVDVDGAALEISIIASQEIHMLFSDTARGNVLRDAYTDGVRAMAADGRLAEIYTRHNQTVPNVE